MSHIVQIDICVQQTVSVNLSRDRPTIGLDQSVQPNSSDNCENERTKVLYMKVETIFCL